jgi:hypothetical protein
MENQQFYKQKNDYLICMNMGLKIMQTIQLSIFFSINVFVAFFLFDVC